MPLRRLFIALLGVLLLASCSPSSPSPTETAPPPDLPAADSVATALASGLAAGDVSKVTFVNAAADAQKDYETIMAGMDKLLPAVSVGGITYNAAKAEASASLNFAFPVGPDGWKYATTATLKYLNDSWRVQWAPSIVHADLTPKTRLRHTRKTATRAPIVGAGGQALVEESSVFQVGIDKANLAPDTWTASAKRLATMLKIDVAGYVEKVTKAGAKAYVVAATLRQADIPGDVGQVPGVLVKDESRMLAPYATFATAILGTSGTATAEEAKASEGKVWAGDLVGKSGLQKRYDEQLRGTPQQSVTLVERKDATPDASAAPFVDKVLFNQDAVAGKPLEISLNFEAQQKAEEVLKKQSGVAALAVVKPSTGEIVALATSPASGQNAYANFGKYAPGSTFKVVSSLALLRAGLTPTSEVSCPSTTQVSTRTFKNYSDYPSSGLGTIQLRQALANSCNTAFVQGATKLSDTGLHEAALSLGVGQDYDAGFAAYYGQVPEPKGDPIGKGGAMIGQGQVLMSPLGMAGVAASVAAGRTTVPWLVKGHQPAPTGRPLTAAEAQHLQQMMTYVVTDGTGKVLKGAMTGAKTGTAQYDQANLAKTDAWMIAWKPDLAIAVWVRDGASGSKAAAPIILDYLR